MYRYGGKCEDAIYMTEVWETLENIRPHFIGGKMINNLPKVMKLTYKEIKERFTL